MLHAFLWCPSVNSFKFHTCVHTTPGGECLRHFCSKRVPKACLTPKKWPTVTDKAQQRSKVRTAALVLTSHQMSAKLRKSSANIENYESTLQESPRNTTNRREYRSILQAQICRLRAKVNAIEIPSFDVINGTTRVSDPL